MESLKGILKDTDGACQRLANPLINESEALKLLEDLYAQIKSNCCREPNKWSKENWRWERQPYINERKNKSSEKLLEKAFVCVMDDKWVNQVPVASGLTSGKADKKRAIDLIFHSRKSEYEFIELKTESNNPYYGAVEILCYGLLYLFHRLENEYCKQSCNSPEKKKILYARRITLKVLAPDNFYNIRGKAKQYEQVMDRTVSKFARRLLPGFSMRFCFEKFSWKKGLSEQLSDGFKVLRGIVAEVSRSRSEI